MLKRHSPRSVYAGGMLLSVVAGSVNAVAMGSAYNAVTHMTGTVYSVSFELAQGKGEVALRAAAVVVSFFVGATLSGLLIRQQTLKPSRRYGIALMIEGLLLCGAWVGMRTQHVSGELLAALACGLQNAMATAYSGAVLRTTHMTGIVTDLGIAIGHWLMRAPMEWVRVRLHLALLTGFTAGGALGAFGFSFLGANTLLFPAVTVLVVGLLYTIQRQRGR